MRSPVPGQQCLRWIPLLALSALCACVGPRSSPLDGDPYGGVSTISSAGSILQLPEDMAQLRLATRRKVDRGTVVEEVVLANDTAIVRENVISTRTRWRGMGAYMPAELPNPFKLSEIESRFAEEFPGAPLDQAARERRNQRGVHRYLLADMGDAGSCIYAWQYFDAPTETRGEIHSFAVDMRYCVPEKDAVRMLDLFDRMAMVAPL
jgi:hypothetical protein